MTTQQDILLHKVSGHWRFLESIAFAMAEDASLKAGVEFQPVLGGGTRLMLALNHRISDDIDLFIRDPQWIGYLTPRLNDRFSDPINDYEEGATSLKVRFDQGEIDFIVSMSLLGLPNERSQDCQFLLEPVEEVLAKKLFYRGWALTPRDLFDWYMIENLLSTEQTHSSSIAALLKNKTGHIQNALQAMRTSTKSQIIWTGIKTHHQLNLNDAIDWADNRILRLRNLV